MPRQSKTEHVKKICGCVKWKECAHPWFVDYREGNKYGKKAERVLRKKLAPLVGREPVDFADAKTEAQRAILAWKDGRDARTLIPGDAPTLATLLDTYATRPDRPFYRAELEKFQRGRLTRTVVNGRPFGDWRGADITREMIESFRQQRPRIGGNRDLQMLRAMFNWAVVGGLVPSTPFKVGNVSAIKLGREEPRTRRLYPGEAGRLLDACAAGTDAHGRPYGGNPELRALMIAALETGCRKGELLSLCWWQVTADLFFPAEKTKAKKARRVPISGVLRGVLDARRHDPAGDPLPPAAFVFGDEVGRRRGSIKTAWRLACQRAKIDDLHFHDLRRECGSRWLENGVPLATIQKWLGHANISQTSTYLAATHGGDADAMAAFERSVGRTTPAEPALPQIAATAGSSGSQQAPTDSGLSEKTQENATIH
jgi:integrase